MASRRSATTRADDPRSPEPGNSTERGCEVIAVTKPYRGEGVTLVAASLAFAAGVSEERTVLVDANTRVGSVEFQVGANPALNMAQLMRRVDETTGQDAAWDTFLASELQAIGPPSGAQVLCGITRVRATDPAVRCLLQGAPRRVERALPLHLPGDLRFGLNRG
jgi:Mrp family chromosome partitioning ATPase